MQEDFETWRGRRVLLVDGATITLGYTDENQAGFLQPSGHKSGLRFSMGRIVARMCLGASQGVRSQAGTPPKPPIQLTVGASLHGVRLDALLNHSIYDEYMSAP